MAEAKWKGLDRAIARLNRFPTELKTTVRAALEIEANGLVDAMKRAVPVESGTLRDTIQVVPGPHELSLRIVAGGSATTKKVRSGVTNGDFEAAKDLAEQVGGAVNLGEFDYMRAVEFGHLTTKGKLIPAHPFFFPTYRARKKPMKRRIAAAARNELKTLFPE